MIKPEEERSIVKKSWLWLPAVFLVYSAVLFLIVTLPSFGLFNKDANIQFIDRTIPLAKAGDPGWDYVKRVKFDADKDGELEEIVVIAKIDKVGTNENYVTAPGTPWQAYIEEKDGKRTYLYSGTQFRRVDIFLGTTNNTLALTLDEGEKGYWLADFTYTPEGKITNYKYLRHSSF